MSCRAVGVDVRESVGIAKGEVKAKSGAVGRKDSSFTGGVALSARLCRNVGEAERERTGCDPKDRDRTIPE